MGQAVLTFLLTILILPILDVEGNVLGRRDQKETTPTDVPGLYIELDQPALCNGQITHWDLCYYSPSAVFYGSSLPIELQVWRFDETLSEGIKVIGYVVNVSIPENPERFQCISIEVTQDDLMEVNEGDYLGVWLYENTFLPVVKYTLDFRRLLFAPPETFSGVVPTTVRFPTRDEEMYYTAEGAAIHVTANITAGNTTDDTSLLSSSENSLSDRAQIIIIGVVSAVAGIELVALVIILLFCIACKWQTCRNKDSEPGHPERTGRNSQTSNFHPPRTSQYYATIAEVALPTTPSIITEANSSYQKSIDVKLNEAYNHFSSSQELERDSLDSPYEDNDAYNRVSLSEEVDSDSVAYGRVEERQSTISYEYPSQRGVFVLEKSENDVISAVDEEATTFSIYIENVRALPASPV